MQKTKANRKPAPRHKPSMEFGEVLTLAEAAAYLRVPEEDVASMVTAGRLPARQIGEEWRFSRAGLQEWLGSSVRRREGLLSQIGAFKDDPDLDKMLKEIYRQRGRPMTEEG